VNKVSRIYKQVPLSAGHPEFTLPFFLKYTALNEKGLLRWYKIKIYK
jgi:hypothetical protein